MKLSVTEEETIILTRRFVDRYKDLTINYLKFLKEINQRILIKKPSDSNLGD
jgi:hypothetical protein